MRFVDILKQLVVKDSYSQSAFLIFLSKILIVVFTFLATPIIARFYLPEDYGVYALINSAMSFITLLCTWSLASEIIVCDKKDLKPLIYFIVQFGFIISSILLFAILIIDIPFSVLNIFSIESIYVFLLPIFVVIISLSEVFASLNIREKAFRRNIIVNTSEIFINKSTSLFLGVLSFTKMGLIISDFIGKFLNVIIQISNRPFGNGFKGEFKRVLFFNDFRFYLKKYKDYWKYHLPSLFIGKMSSHVMIWLLVFFYSRGELGHYTMAISLLSIPLNLFSNSLQPIIMSKMTELKKSASKKVTFNMILILVLIGAFVIYSIIFMTSSWFVPLYLGANWMKSILFIKILCFSFALTLVVNSLSGLYVVFGMQKTNFKIKLFFSTLLFVSVCLSVFFDFTVYEVVLITVASSILEDVFRIFNIRNKIINISL